MEVFLVAGVWDVLRVVANQALSLDGNLVTAVLVDDLFAEVGVGADYISVAFEWTVVDHTLRRSPIGDKFAFAILLTLGGSRCEGSVWAWSGSRCEFVCGISWCGAKTGETICLIIAVVHRVEKVVDAKHMSVGRLRSLLARDAITTVTGRADRRKHGMLRRRGLGHGVVQKRERMLRERCKQTGIA
jgi:hypothetical protein